MSPTVPGRSVSGTSGRPVVLVTGATSQLGVFLIPRLLHAGYRVIAVSRRVGSTVPVGGRVDWVGPDFVTAPTKYSPPQGVPEIRGMISCGPLDLAVLAATKFNSLDRVIAFSTSSVSVKAESGNAAEREQMAQILDDEQRLQSACDRLGTDWLVLRPTLIYGCGLDRTVSRLATLIRKFGLVPVAGPARGLRQPVHADDLAGLAVEALGFSGPLALVSPACGGETLTYREMVGRIFDGLGRPRRIPGLPAGLLAAAVGMAAGLGLARGLNREMLRRQNRDLVFDDRSLRERLGYHPRPFRPTPADFEVPADALEWQLPQP